MAIKMIGLDLDGTLLTSDKRLTAYTKQVLMRALDKGIVVLAATGRPKSGIPEIFMNLPGIRYAITTNGARIYDGETVIIEDPVPVEDTKKILEIFQKYDTLREVYVSGKPYVSAKEYETIESYVMNDAMAFYMRKSKTPSQDLMGELFRAGTGSDKVHALFKNETERQKAFRDLENISTIDVSSALFNNIEVNKKDVNKGRALIRLGEKLGIRREEIMAAGDGLNDISMLKAAGFSVAPSNGMPEALAAADKTVLSNDEDGVAKAIEKYAFL